MRDTTKEILDKYQVRKSKKQKTAFIDYIKGVCRGAGYEARVERGSFGARNIVVGNPTTAKVVYTAHYDTCPVLPMPNFITPKNFFIYLLYQLLLTAVIMLLPMALLIFVVDYFLTFVGVDPSYHSEIIYASELIFMLFIMWLIMFGPANKHTANDNTSGVTTLVNIIEDIPFQMRDQVAFIFFDLEEVGLVGSSSYAKAHKHAMKDKLLINFDCVSDGNNMLLVLGKGARAYKKLIENAYVPTDDLNVLIESKGVFYPSDQAAFKCGVGVASLKATKRGMLYMDRIHTKRDTVYEERNVEYLKESSITLVKQLSEGDK